MMIRKLVIILILAISITNTYAVYVGICDGYIRDMEGRPVQGANVVVNVKDCFGPGCSGNTLSDVNGYYVIGNLNIPKNGIVYISASKSGSSGSIQGQADSYMIAHVDVVLCTPPSSPSLDLVEDAHKTTFILSWTSGKDIKGFSTYDELKIDNSVIKQNSPYLLSTSFGVHNWGVRTCNEFCCSSWSEDSFNAVNNAPSRPITNTTFNFGIVTMSWISGIDPDNDSTYDQIKIGDEEIMEAKSPIIRQMGRLIDWRVRTCDIFGACSPWSDEAYINCEVINETCPTSEEIQKIVKTITMQINQTKKEEVEVWCNGVRIDKGGIVNKIELRFEKGRSEIGIKGDSINLKNIEDCNWYFTELEKKEMKPIIKWQWYHYFGLIGVIFVLILIIIKVIFSKYEIKIQRK